MNSRNNTHKLNHKIKSRVIRFDDMIPCKTAFIDARNPGSDQKENFCLIGNGVAENPDQVVHIDIAHGFNVGAARQPKGCKNSHHSHDTEEVFMIHSGEWNFTWGENGEDGNIILKTGDTISLPCNMFRGFENVGDDNGIMFSILGLNKDGSAGHVVWAPYVFEEAKRHGLVLLEDGQLIDTSTGAKVPTDAKTITPTSPEQVASLDRLSLDDMQKCIAHQTELDSLSNGGLSHLDGVSEIAVLGNANAAEKIEHGKISWSHGFQMRRIIVEPGTSIPSHSREEEEVLIIQSGLLDIKSPDYSLTLNHGDLFSVPINSDREYNNSSNEIADIIVIRRGNNPAAAHFK